MPIYEFRCLSCGEITEQLCRIGTTASRCEHCGNFAVLVLSVTAKPIIRHGQTGAFSDSSNAAEFSPLAPQDNQSVRVYNFEFGATERDRLAHLADKEIGRSQTCLTLR